MKRRAIDVSCYSGARADEAPRRVIVDGREHRVGQIIASSVEESPDTRERSHRFRIITDEGLVLDIRRNHERKWFLESATRGNPL